MAADVKTGPAMPVDEKTGPTVQQVRDAIMITKAAGLDQTKPVNGDEIAAFHKGSGRKFSVKVTEVKNA